MQIVERISKRHAHTLLRGKNEIKYAECVFSSVYYIFLPYIPSPLSAHRHISYAKPRPYLSPKDLCLDLSMCLKDMWGQQADCAGVKGTLFACQTAGCGEKQYQYLAYDWCISTHSHSYIIFIKACSPGGKENYLSWFLSSRMHPISKVYEQFIASDIIISQLHW